LRADRCDIVMQRAEARQHHSWSQQRGGQGSSVSRLAYLLNPMMPCKSPLLVGHWVARLADLLPALEEVAGNAERHQTDPIDTHIAAFIAARLERRMDHELLTQVGGDAASLAQIRVLAQLQSRLYPQPLPALAAWLAVRARPVVSTWKNRERRAGIEQRLQPLAAAGYLAPMLHVLDDPGARSADAQEAQDAAVTLAGLDTELAQITGGAAIRTATATRVGQEIAAGLGLAALAAALVIAALG
jgi:eukaryotic-like serine/threonine-protein kinase